MTDQGLAFDYSLSSLFTDSGTTSYTQKSVFQPFAQTLGGIKFYQSTAVSTNHQYYIVQDRNFFGPTTVTTPYSFFQNCTFTVNDASTTTTGITFSYLQTAFNSFTLAYGTANDAPVTFPEPLPAVAVKRAEKLLKGLLTSRQRTQWERFRYIVVPSQKTLGVVYKIPASGLIRRFKDGKPEVDLCIYPLERLPDGDRVAAFKLMIEANENELLQTAIRHEIRPRPTFAPAGPEIQYAGGVLVG